MAGLLSAWTKEDRRLADEKRAAQRRRLAAGTPQELMDKVGLVVEGKQRDQIADRLSQMPPTSKGTYLRAMKGNSPTAAIKAHCMECVGWQREEVRQCTGRACPLFPYRPFKD